VLALASAPAVSAQTRPLQTEEAATAAAGTVAIEIGGQAVADEPNFLTGAPRTRWDAPELRVVYSPADRVEIDVEWVARVGARDDLDYGDVSDFGDVSLRAKVRLAGGPGARTTAGARFTVTLPQTSFGNGLGPNTLRMSAQALLSRAVGRGALHLNAGLAIHDEPLRAHEQRDFLAYGVALVAPPLGPATLLAEVAGLAGEGAPGADARHEARAGVRIGAGAFRADAAVRRGLGDADGTWGVTAGLTWRR
jgi:hypothetical protein